MQLAAHVCREVMKNPLEHSVQPDEVQLLQLEEHGLQTEPKRYKPYPHVKQDAGLPWEQVRQEVMHGAQPISELEFERKVVKPERH